MQKVIKFGLIVFLLYSCSTIHKEKSLSSNQDNSLSIRVEDLRKGNVLSDGLFIQAMDIEVLNGKESIKFLGSMKFERPDKYLFSFKSKSGIEASRIFINEDSIYITDRFNGKLYKGDVSYVKKKFGIDFKILPLFLGDIVGKENNSGAGDISVGNKVLKILTEERFRIIYTIDCETKRVISAEVLNILNEEILMIRYLKYYKQKERFIPEKIEIIVKTINSRINIRIRKSIYPWNDIIKYNFSKRYDLINL